MRQLQCLLYHNRCYNAGRYIEPSKIVLHSTGAANSQLRRYVQPHAEQSTGMAEYQPVQRSYTNAEMIAILGKNQYGNHWNRAGDNYGNGLYACVNAFIGKLADGTIATVQTLPWKMRPWGVGSGRNGSYNDVAIQFEICEDDHSSRSYCEATFLEAAELCAHLMQNFTAIKSVADIVSHDEAHTLGYASNHDDPTRWWSKFGLSMDKFRAKVQELLDAEPAERPGKQPKDPVEQPKEDRKLYRIRKSWEDSGSQLGAYGNLDYAIEDCPEGYTVYDWDGQPVYVHECQKYTLDYAQEHSHHFRGPHTIKAYGGLYLRSGASTDKAVIELMPDGATVQCYGWYTDEWLYVVSSSGRVGFAHSAYLVKQQEG